MDVTSAGIWHGLTYHMKGGFMHSGLHSLPRFSGLPHIDGVAHFSVSQDGPCFDDIAKVLFEHNSQERFAVTLLHVHFPVTDNEVLLQTVDIPNRVISVTVMPIPELHHPDLKPVSWRLKPPHVGDHLPLQYMYSSVDLNDYEVTEQDKSCMDAVAGALALHGALDRFGLSFSLPSIEATEVEYLLESTNVEARVQEIAPEPLRNLDESKSIQTSWKLKMPSDIESWLRCKKKTETWCDRYCQTRCDYWPNVGHRYDHRGARHKKESNTVHYE